MTLWLLHDLMKLLDHLNLPHQQGHYPSATGWQKR